MKGQIRVWDPLVRLFHWSLVLFFIVAYLSGEEESLVHINAGYIVAGLVAFRIVWGFFGTKYARFSQFMTTPAGLMEHIKELPDQSKRYIGHNPAGGWMVIAMLVTLSIATLSGFKVYAIEEGKGPLAADLPSITLISEAHADSDDDDDDDHDEHEYGHRHGHEENEEEEFWEEIHEASANFMVLLILLHIAGVVVMSQIQGENLVKSMITGKKIE